MVERIDPGHRRKRLVLRVLGPTLLVGGLALLATAFMRFLGGFGSPMEAASGTGLSGTFGRFFLGGLLLVVGVVMTQFGFMGSVARYAAGETAPVARDTFNYVATGSQAGLHAVGSAVGQGFAAAQAAAAAGMVACASCGTGNDPDARFCDSCGTRLA